MMWVLVVVSVAAPKPGSFEARAAAVEQTLVASRELVNAGNDPSGAAREAIAQARALRASAPKNPRAAMLLGFALEQGATYGIPADGLEVLGNYRDCVIAKGPESCRTGYERASGRYTAPRCLTVPAGAAVELAHEGKGPPTFVHAGTELAVDGSVAGPADIQSVALVDTHVEMQLTPEAATKLRAATKGTGRIMVRVGNDVVAAPSIAEQVSNPFAFGANDIATPFAKLCPKPEKRTVPAKLALPPAG